MKLRLQNLERIYKQFIMLLVDVSTLLFALWLSFVLRCWAVLFKNYTMLYGNPVGMIQN